MSAPIAVVLSPHAAHPPEPVVEWLDAVGLAWQPLRDAESLLALAFRSRPRLVIFDARDDAAGALGACVRLKSDSYTGIVPCVTLCGSGESTLVRAFRAGSDEVLPAGTSAAEVRERLTGLLRRSDRDVHAHASTRLPGTTDIEREIERRMAAGEVFAVCYADLDHFKEFNDRYSYADGDQVIRIVAMILHDVVKGTAGEEGFVGHIGGDDFIFIVPARLTHELCSEVVEVFDTLVPYQYSEADRRTEYFFGKDRRGQLHRVPLMTLSIGVVTNERRAFTNAAHVSALATEMKSYAKSLVGSVFAVDRRQDAGAAAAHAQWPGVGVGAHGGGESA